MEKVSPISQPIYYPDGYQYQIGASPNSTLYNTVECILKDKHKSITQMLIHFFKECFNFQILYRSIKSYALKIH